MQEGSTSIRLAELELGEPPGKTTPWGVTAAENNALIWKALSDFLHHADGGTFPSSLTLIRENARYGSAACHQGPDVKSNSRVPGPQDGRRPMVAGRVRLTCSRLAEPLAPARTQAAESVGCDVACTLVFESYRATDAKVIPLARTKFQAGTQERKSGADLMAAALLSAMRNPYRLLTLHPHAQSGSRGPKTNTRARRATERRALWGLRPMTVARPTNHCPAGRPLEPSRSRPRRAEHCFMCAGTRVRTSGGDDARCRC